MVCVVQAQPAPLLLELVWREALERGLGCDGHEDGEGHGAMGKMQRRSTRLGHLDRPVSRQCIREMSSTSTPHTEHFPSSSNVSADGIETGAMADVIWAHRGSLGSRTGRCRVARSLIPSPTSGLTVLIRPVRPLQVSCSATLLVVRHRRPRHLKHAKPCYACLCLCPCLGTRLGLTSSPTPQRR